MCVCFVLSADYDCVCKIRHNFLSQDSNWGEPEYALQMVPHAIMLGYKSVIKNY